MTPGVEADDVISAYTRRYTSVNDTIIFSTDSDLLQLVSDSVTVVQPRGKLSIIYGPAEVEAKYGVVPHHIPDLKALTGDKSDNLMGVPGIGPKTASNLIRRFGNVAEIFENLDAIASEAMRDKLRAYREQVYHNVSMIRLDRQVPLPFELSETAVTPSHQRHSIMGLLREAGVAAS